MGLHEKLFLVYLLNNTHRHIKTFDKNIYVPNPIYNVTEEHVINKFTPLKKFTSILT